MNINDIDICELISRGLGDTVYSGSEGVVAKCDDSQIVMSNIEDARRLMEIISNLGLGDDYIYSLKNIDAASALKNELAMHSIHSCSQWVYTGGALPETDRERCIRLLTRDEVKIAAPYYKMEENNEDYFMDRVENGLLWGAFDNNNLTGFIGVHSEGSMGMLEVLPEYRGMGYGYMLERFLIKEHQRRGWVPYCQVIDGNTPSLRLQMKLEMSRTGKPSFWVV